MEDFKPYAEVLATTRTGIKVHKVINGFSRTICGSRVAGFKVATLTEYSWLCPKCFGGASSLKEVQ
jgi:hypothetical protein